MEDTIREHAACLAAAAEGNQLLNRKIKSRFRNSVHEGPVRGRRMVGRAVAYMLLLILFILVHSVWIGRVTRPDYVPVVGVPYGELFQSDSDTDALFSEVWQWGK